MKSKILRTILYINTGLLLLAGCKREEDPLYGKDSSYIERTSPTLSAYGRELRSAANGWLLTLYAGKNQQYGGYNVIVKFDTLRVTAVSELQLEANKITEDKSLYSITSNQQAILSFDTYNKVLQHFVEPSYIFPEGKGGDNQMEILSYKDGVFTLKGTHSNNIMTLSRFEGDTDAYLTAIQQRVKKFKTVGVNPVTIGGKEVQIEIHPSNHQLLMRDGDTSVKKAFIYTEKGFKLYEPITIAGKTFEEFNVSDDYTELSTPDGSIKTGLVYTLPYDFSNYRKVLTFSPMDYKCSSNEKLRNLFYSSLKALENKGSFTVSPEFKLGYLQDKDFLSSEWRDRQGINFTAWYENASSEANYILDFLPVGGKPNQVNIVMVEKGMQWNYYDLLDPVIEYITQNSPYEVIDVDSAYQYELRSVKDPSVRFRSYVYQWTYPLVYDFTSQKGTIEFVDGKVSTRMLKAFTDVKTYKKTTNNTEVTRTLDTKVVLGKNSVKIGNKNRNRTGFTFTIHQTAGRVANLTGSFNVVCILDFITTQCSEKQLNFVDNYNYNNYNWSSNKELAPLVDMFVENAPYETLDNGDGTLKYTSVKDSEVWFIVTK